MLRAPERGGGCRDVRYACQSRRCRAARFRETVGANGTESGTGRGRVNVTERRWIGADPDRVAMFTAIWGSYEHVGQLISLCASSAAG